MTQIVHSAYELKSTAYCGYIRRYQILCCTSSKMKKSISPIDGFSRDALSVSGLDGVDVSTSYHTGRGHTDTGNARRGFVK